jgi:hypothetical protein
MKDRLKSTKKVLLFGVKPQWEVSSLPSSNLADYLSKDADYEVYYISDDLSFFHFLKWGIKIEIIIKFIKSILKILKINNVSYLSSLSFFPRFSNVNKFYDFLFSYLNFQHRSKSLKNLLNEDFDLVFSSSYRNYDDFISVRSRRKIFSIEDNPYGFGVLSKDFLSTAEEKMISKKDIEFWCTSKKLIREKYNNAKYFSNGINNNFDINLQFNTNQKCVYVGAIDDWFDWNLVNNVFEELGSSHGFTLDIYGNGRMDPNKMIETKFIKFHGSIDNKLVQRTLLDYSVGIIPFKINDLINYVNPIKYYEYLSCGLRIVSTDWDELREHDYPNLFLSDRDKFSQNILKAHEYDFHGFESELHNFLESKKYNFIFEKILEI